METIYVIVTQEGFLSAGGIVEDIDSISPDYQFTDKAQAERVSRFKHGTVMPWHKLSKVSPEPAPFTSTQRGALATALRSARPTMPRAKLVAWNECVSVIAHVVCRGQGADQDRINAARFFEACGFGEGV